MTLNVKYLRRYTDLSALIYLLAEQKITLLDPQSWDDRNDSYYLSLYKKSKNLKSVLALCFTMASERYHFWRVYGVGLSGVRIRFKRKELLDAVRKTQGLRMESVEYPKLDKIDKTTLPISKFPFVKRYAFKDEIEFRMVYESEKERITKLDIPISLSCIDKIVLNPWLHPDLFYHVREALCSIKDCRSLTIVHSKLIDNKRWQAAGDKAIKTGGGLE
jgi:hypothetical protein